MPDSNEGSRLEGHRGVPGPTGAATKAMPEKEVEMTRLLVFPVVVLYVSVLGMAQPATAPTTQPTTRAAPRAPVARAVLISGLGGSEAYSRNLLDWSNRLHKVLTTQCGLKAENIVVLTEKADPKATPPRREATLKNVRAAIKKMKQAFGPDDQFILYMAGHGQINEPVGKLCLPGRDLEADELADMLDELPIGKIVILNAASGGAEFIKTCADIGRVILTGAGAEDDGNQTYFAEFLIRGYETHLADANKDKLIDLMEAYLYAARETANFYHRQYLLGGGRRRAAGDALVWDVRGKNTRAIWRKLYAGTTNGLGKPPQLPDQPPPPDPETEPDKEPRFGDFGPNWHNRRVLAEHARLDDNAGKMGFYLWQPYEFVKPPKDEPGGTGYLARRTVLGKTGQLERALGK